MSISNLSQMGYYHANAVPPEATTGWQSGGVPAAPAPQPNNWQSGGVPAGQPDQYSEMTPEEMFLAQLEQIQSDPEMRQALIEQLGGFLPTEEAPETAAAEEPAATPADEPPAATGTDPNPYTEFTGLERKSNPLKAGLFGLASSAIAATVGAVIPGNHDNKLIYQAAVAATASGAAGGMEYATGGDANSVALAMGVGGAGGFAGSHKLASVKKDVNFTNGVLEITPKSLQGATDDITINNIETATNALQQKNERIAKLTAQGLKPETAQQLATAPLPDDWVPRAMRIFQKLGVNYSPAELESKLSSPDSLRKALRQIERPWRNIVPFNPEPRFTRQDKDLIRALLNAIENTKRPSPPPAVATPTTAPAAATP